MDSRFEPLSLASIIALRIANPTAVAPAKAVNLMKLGVTLVAVTLVNFVGIAGARENIRA